MARVLSEQIRIQLLAKSLIVRVYDILARHSTRRHDKPSWFEFRRSCQVFDLNPFFCCQNVIARTYFRCADLH